MYISLSFLPAMSNRRDPLSDPALESWRRRQEAEKERLVALGRLGAVGVAPPARPPKKAHLREQQSEDAR